eukprot:c14307_g1_i1 orf=110-340(+)
MNGQRRRQPNRLARQYTFEINISTAQREISLSLILPEKERKQEAASNNHTDVYYFSRRNSCTTYNTITKTGKRRIL